MVDDRARDVAAQSAAMKHAARLRSSVQLALWGGLAVAGGIGLMVATGTGRAERAMSTAMSAAHVQLVAAWGEPGAGSTHGPGVGLQLTKLSATDAAGNEGFWPNGQSDTAAVSPSFVVGARLTLAAPANGANAATRTYEIIEVTPLRQAGAQVVQGQATATKTARLLTLVVGREVEPTAGGKAPQMVRFLVDDNGHTAVNDAGLHQPHAL